MKILNVFDSNLTAGEKVCIIAPGPNGSQHYHEIPKDFTKIVVNKAIQIEEVKPDWWIIAHTNTSWFNKADRHYSGTRVYSYRALPSISKTALKMSADKVYFFYLEKEPLRDDIVLPINGLIRYGASVSALAIQLAYNLGAKEILLCGVDMSGNSYWDKTENEDPEVLDVHGDIWSSVKRLNPLLHYLRNELNIKVSTLSESKLDIPYYTKES
ncbi:MAG: hypothetical protein COA88_13295 [Kordia sp.]|nr:MAG: hypothetical protein COA88_13295 [Kordia sp.]